MKPCGSSAFWRLPERLRPASRMTASATLKATTDITGELRLSLRFATDSETRAAVVKRAGCPPLSVAANPKSTVKRGHEEFVTPGYGFQPSVTVFTKLARQTIKEAAAVIERDYGKRALFITGTLPGGTGAALASIANWSAYIVERVGQWLRDNIAPHELVLVWERQSRGALHLHACLGCFDVASLRFVAIRWRAFLTRLLETVSDKSGLDLFGRAVGGSWRGVYSKVRANACPVRHSVRRYLSKYMSKNRISRNNWRADRAGRQVFFPTRWWGITASLRRKVKECRIVNESLPIPLPVATDLWQQCVGLLSDGQRKLFVYKNHYRPG